jgi:hypothetical protein
LRNGVISLVSLIALIASGLALDGIRSGTDRDVTAEYVVIGATVLWLVGAALWVGLDRRESGER